MGKINDIIGKRFGRLTVLRYTHSNSNKKRCYECQCDCGSILNTVGASLIKGDTTSCGCFQKECITKIQTTHGLVNVHKKEYESWCRMKARCLNPKNKDFHHYGGRGIKIAPEWINDFGQFYKDMGPRPEGFTLERLRNDGNYEPGNVTWADRQTQSNNTRQNVNIFFNGKTLNMTQWAEELGVSRGIIKRRFINGEPLDKKYINGRPV